MLEELVQGSPAWLDFRKRKLGASDSPIIMGVSPFKSAYKLWREKLDLDPPQAETQAMKWGKIKEEEARQEFIRRTGIEVFPDVRVSDKVDYLMASVDGISSDKKTLIEIKNPMSPKPEVVPEMYKPQVQKQMYIYELERMIYFDYTSGFMIEVYRDDSLIKDMLEQEACFWECIRTLTPPKSRESDYIQRWDDPFCKAALHLKEVREKIKDLEKQEGEVRDYLIQLAQGLNCKGMGLSVSKDVRKGTIDYARLIKELLPQVDLEKYRKPNIETWRVA